MFYNKKYEEEREKELAAMQDEPMTAKEARETDNDLSLFRSLQARSLRPEARSMPIRRVGLNWNDSFKKTPTLKAMAPFQKLTGQQKTELKAIIDQELGYSSDDLEADCQHIEILFDLIAKKTIRLRDRIAKKQLNIEPTLVYQHYLGWLDSLMKMRFEIKTQELLFARALYYGLELEGSR